MAWSADGSLLISSSFDGTIRVWELASGKALRTFADHGSWVTAIAFSRASNLVISASSDRSIRIWDLAGTQIRALTLAHSNDIWALAVSPDGKKIVSGGHDRLLKLRDISTGGVLEELRGHSDTVLCVAFSPDGRRVVSGSDDATVRVWDLETASEAARLEPHKEAVRSVAWMRDGRIVSASMDKTIRVHGAPSAILRAHAGAVGAVALSHDEGLMASASFDGTVRIWDSATYGVLDVLREKCSKFPVGLAFHPAKPILAMVVGGGNAIEILELNPEAARPSSEPTMVSDQPYRKVWVYMADGKNTQDLQSLERRDAHTWAANPNSREGDVILMYRTAPHSDFRYVFQAQADPRPARPSEDFAEWVIRLGNKRTLQHPVTLAEIKAEPGLRNWSFTKMQQGAMKWTHDVRQQEFWPSLRDLILRHNPGILADRPDTAPAAKRAGFRYAAYLSYDRSAQLPIERIYDALSKELKSYVEAPIFLGRHQIKPGDSRLEEALAHALFGSACFIPICTPNYFDNPSCIREYVAMETLESQRLAPGVLPANPQSPIIPIIVGRVKALPPALVRRRSYAFNWPSTAADENSKETQSAIAELARKIVGRCGSFESRPEAFANPDAFSLPSEEEARAWLNAGLPKENRPVTSDTSAEEPQAIDIPRELIERTIAGQTVLFIGAAMSSPPLPLGWRALLDEMLAWAEGRQIDLGEGDASIRELIRENSLATASQELRERLGPELFVECLRAILGGPHAQPGPAYWLLPDIRFSAIISSNFDELIDQVFPRAPKLTQVDTGELRRLGWRGDFFIAKIRGTLSRPETLVFDQADFARMKFGSKEIRDQLRTIFSTQTVLFVGSSLTDPDLRLFLEEMAFNGKSEPRHYALMRTRGLNSALRRYFETQNGIRIFGDDQRQSYPDIYRFLVDFKAQVQRARHTDLPAAMEGEAYRLPLGGAAGSWRLVQGALPDGLKMDYRSGEIAGIPKRPGNFTFELDITISSSAHGHTSPARSYSIEVKPAPLLTYAVTLDASPAELTIGESTTLAVVLRRAHAGSVQLQVPDGVTEIHCFVTAEGFRVEGPEAAAVRVGDYGAASEASFALRSRLRGKRTITVDFYVEDFHSERVRIYSANIAVNVKPPVAAQTGVPILPVLDVRVGPHPDVVLYVSSNLPEGDDGPIVLTYSISTRLLRPAVSRKPSGSVTLTASARAAMRALLFETLADVEGMAPTDVRERLLSFGTYVFQQLFPASSTAEFHAILHELGDRVRTLLVSGDQTAWLPWEFAAIPGQASEPRLLAGQFRMGRWIEGLGPAPCQQIPIGELVLVHYLNIARPETDSELEAWRTLLKAHCGAGMALAVKPETPVFGIHILRRQTAGEPRDIVPRTKTNELQSPEADARTARLDLRAKRPVVGFSVIGMSSAGEALTADRAVPFIRCGASALVGPWWPTAERCDEVFWSSFYNLLWRRVPLGEAVWRARLAVRNAWPNRADWLSYTLVGDPQARPYEPEPGEGYASLEALDATGVMNPGRPYKFRVSLRSRPPVWYADKLVRTGTPPAGLTAMFLGPHLEIAPQGPVAMCQAGRSMTEAVVNVTAHNEGIFPLIVQLLEGDEHVRTLQLTLRFDH